MTWVETVQEHMGNSEQYEWPYCPECGDYDIRTRSADANMGLVSFILHCNQCGCHLIERRTTDEVIDMMCKELFYG